MTTFYLTNKNDGEIADVVANTFEEATKTASEILGGEPSDYINRFSEEPLFICYETEQKMTKKDWFLFYLTSEEIDKTEYKDFTEWWTDMRRSGVLEKV